MTDLKEISVGDLSLVGPAFVKKLKKLGIETIWDLFHHVPTRFLDFSKNISIKDLKIDETATIKGTVTSIFNQYTKKGKPMQIVTISDETGKVNAIWFNQIYLLKNFREGTKVAIAGKLSFLGRQRAIISPEYEILKENEGQIHTGSLIPIYSETAGVSSKWLRRRIHDAWERYKDGVVEFLPEEILKKYNLTGFNDAIKEVHFPSFMEEFEKAKHRLAFNELLTLHTKNLERKKKWEENKVSAKLEIRNEEIEKFIKKLSFKLTSSQEKVIKEILDDLKKDIPMNRLLEGDVGSGKTIVAAVAIYSVFLNGKKSILMAPTQILAEQHFNTLKKLFKNLRVGIFTSTNKSVGEFDVIVGTHALLSSKANMKNVSLVVIDEQHKFGVEQRNVLVKKGSSPHVLVMTATPIPRTVALTFFGDLQLSTLNEMPKGRQKIVTWVVPETKRESGFKWIHDLIKKEKVQAYVVCPLIDESETETMIEVKAANKEYENLKEKFGDLKIGLMHGKLKAEDKNKVIGEFKSGKSDMLVSTPVVEVGIDIPNATIMVIEGADRFGLASLHQLRGRVGRGHLKSYCLLMTDSESEKTKKRLTAMTKNLTGFELAELDLAMRGPGEIFGKKQSGIPELKIADWNDLETIKDSRVVAEKLVGTL